MCRRNSFPNASRFYVSPFPHSYVDVVQFLRLLHAVAEQLVVKFLQLGDRKTHEIAANAAGDRARGANCVAQLARSVDDETLLENLR